MKYLIIMMLLIESSKSDFIFKDESLFSESKCFDKINKKIGICKSITQCPEIFKSISASNSKWNHTVCGFEGDEQIVCCPSLLSDDEEYKKLVQIEVKETNSQLTDILRKTINITSEFNQRDFNCFDRVNNFQGVQKFKKHCPALSSMKPNNEVYCDHELCRDIVCCPINLNRLAYQCFDYDTPMYEIEKRIKLKLPCVIPGTNQTGKYSQKQCVTTKDATLQKVCFSKYCKTFFCCASDEPPGKECTPTKLLINGGTEIISKSCFDKLRNQKGTCRPSKTCPKLFGMDAVSCGEDCCTEFICCPDDDYSSMSVPERKCSEYSRFAYTHTRFVPLPSILPNDTDCGFYSAAAGGIESKPLEFPHMAALGYKMDNDNILWGCGGSVISDQFILTAGHCLKSSEFGEVHIARLGVVWLNRTDVRYDCPEDFKIQKIIPHPDYTSRLVYNDIALLKLDRQITFNLHIRPLCLPASSDLPDKYFSMGWGATGPLEPSSNALILVSQYLFSFEECQEKFTGAINRRFNRGLDNETQICLGSRETIESTCLGDSGGPVISDGDYHKMHVIYGVVSFGPPCGFSNSPGIYTKVYPYVKWIEKMVWG